MFISKLNVSMSDTVLELGCGRAVGMFDAFQYMNMSKIIGIDISKSQTDRAETKKIEGRIKILGKN
jgi:cyclopropane fatty-acyl-phospholipid synthase-like methyltransferase